MCNLLYVFYGVILFSTSFNLSSQTFYICSPEHPCYGPRALSRHKPECPKSKFHIDGKVKVKFDVNPEGNVENIKIIYSYPSDFLVDDVMNAMSKWRYVRGKPGKGLIITIDMGVDLMPVSCNLQIR